MGQRYVWWDELERVERHRVDLRVPKPLHEFLAERCQIHGVSMNALITGILAHAVDAGKHHKLRIEVIPSVRVTASKPDHDPVHIPVPAASPEHAKRWTKH